MYNLFPFFRTSWQMYFTNARTHCYFAQTKQPVAFLVNIDVTDCTINSCLVSIETITMSQCAVWQQTFRYNYCLQMFYVLVLSKKLKLLWHFLGPFHDHARLGSTVSNLPWICLVVFSLNCYQSPSTVFARWQTNNPDGTETCKHFSLTASSGIAMMLVPFFTLTRWLTVALPEVVGSWFLSTSRICTIAKCAHLRWHMHLLDDLILHDAWQHCSSILT